MKKMLIYWKVPLLLCCLAVALEFFVFNFRHWESYLWRDEHVLMQEWLVGPGLRQIEPTLYEVTEADGDHRASEYQPGASQYPCGPEDRESFHASG